MFKNIGEKLKSLAKFLCTIGIFIGITGGIILMSFSQSSWHNQWMLSVGIAVLILVPLLSWLSSLFIYALGELVENSAVQADILAKILKKYEE